MEAIRRKAIIEVCRYYDYHWLDYRIEHLKSGNVMRIRGRYNLTLKQADIDVLVPAINALPWAIAEPYTGKKGLTIRVRYE